MKNDLLFFKPFNSQILLYLYLDLKAKKKTNDIIIKHRDINLMMKSEVNIIKILRNAIQINIKKLAVIRIEPLYIVFKRTRKGFSPFNSELIIHFPNSAKGNNITMIL
jgi:hypothetical protein